MEKQMKAEREARRHPESRRRESSRHYCRRGRSGNPPFSVPTPSNSSAFLRPRARRKAIPRRPEGQRRRHLAANEAMPTDKVLLALRSLEALGCRQRQGHQDHHSFRFTESGRRRPQHQRADDRPQRRRNKKVSPYDLRYPGIPPQLSRHERQPRRCHRVRHASGHQHLPAGKTRSTAIRPWYSEHRHAADLGQSALPAPGRSPDPETDLEGSELFEVSLGELTPTRPADGLPTDPAPPAPASRRMLCEGRFALYPAGEPYKVRPESQGCGKRKKGRVRHRAGRGRKGASNFKAKLHAAKGCVELFCYGILWTERNNHKGRIFMDSYVTGTAIRQLREAKHLTAELAESWAVSAKSHLQVGRQATAARYAVEPLAAPRRQRARVDAGEPSSTGTVLPTCFAQAQCLPLVAAMCSTPPGRLS